MEPTDPIERIEPAEPIESTEPSEPTESTDAREATERRELLMPRLMYPPNASANSVATAPVLPDPPDIAGSKNPRDTRRHLAPPIVDRQRRSFVNCINARLAGTLPSARHAGLGDAFLVPQAGTLALVPPDRGGRESAAFELRHRWTRGLCDLHVVEHRQGVREGGDDRDAPTPPEMRSYLAVNAVRRDARHRGAPPLLSYTRTCARQTVHTPTTWARQEGPFALRYVRGRVALGRLPRAPHLRTPFAPSAQDPAREAPAGPRKVPAFFDAHAHEAESSLLSGLVAGESERWAAYSVLEPAKIRAPRLYRNAREQICPGEGAGAGTTRRSAQAQVTQGRDCRNHLGQGLEPLERGLTAESWWKWAE